MIDWKWILINRIFRQKSRSYELQVKRALQAVARNQRGGVFWDVGANIGYYSLLLREYFSLVVAVEPHPETFKELSERTGDRHGLTEIDPWHNIVSLNLALTDHEGPIDIWENEQPENSDRHNRFASSSLSQEFEYNPGNPQLYARRNSTKSFTVIGKTFDSFNGPFSFWLLGPPTTNYANVVELVKIDVEGAEFLVLDGMRNSLREGRVKNLMIELHDGARRYELIELLRGYGFIVDSVDPIHYFAFKTPVTA